MTPHDPRFPDDERPKVDRAIADLEVEHLAGRRPDLAALAPPGPWRVPYLLALIPYDMRYLRKAGAVAEAAVEAYLAAFPELAADPGAVAGLVEQEYAARQEGAAAGGGTGKTTLPDLRARFEYEARFPALWPRLFPYADTARLPEPGERIGESCRVRKEEGRGGMGVVFDCVDEALNRRVAVKLLNPGGPLAADPRFRDRFLREAKAMARIDHPNVVRVHAFGRAGPPGREVPYFVMEYVEGKTLEDLGRLDPAAAVRVARGLALGLRAVHAANLVHRDVKPGNVILRGTGDPVLLDLGVVRSTDGGVGLTEAGGLMGTAGYMAPEQSLALDVDHRADLFSLGCVLYRAVTGLPPFDGDRVTAILLKVRTEHPPPADGLVPGLPPGLGGLIARLMAKPPADRPASADEVLAELDAIEAGTPPADVPPEPGPVSGAGRRRRWYWAGGAAAAVAVAAALAVVGRGCGRPGGPPAAYAGRADATVHRSGDWVPLLHPAALPLKTGHHFKVTVRVDPPAYLYVFWVEGDGEASPLYPWSPGVGWGSRPGAERPVSHLTLPEESDFTPDPRKPLDGVTTIVALARPDPLPLSDDEVRRWFEGLPRIERAKDDTRAVVWFDNYAPPRADATRAPQVAGLIDPYERWQVELKKRVGAAAAFQTSVSFAQAGGK